MRKSIIFAVMIMACHATVVSGEEISRENMAKINRELDSILMSAQGSYGISRQELTDRIVRVKMLLAGREHGRWGGDAFNESEMGDLIVRVKKAWPYRDQKVLLQRVSANSRFSMKQIRRILEIIDFPDDKKDAARILLPRAVDPENIDELYRIFWTPSDKEYINALLPR
jgi:hypothetical protein